MACKKIQLLIVGMVLFIPLSVSAHIETTTTLVLLPHHLIKFIIILMFLWFIKLVLDNAMDRYHLIRNLYSEIERNHSLFSTVNLLFPKWKEDNINVTKEPALMERLTWNKTLSTRVYDCSQTNIIKSLWGKEITNIHELYSNYIELDRLLVSVATEINVAKREYIYSTPVDNGKELLESTNKYNIKVVYGKVTDIKDLLDKVCEKKNGRECARIQFYPLKFYLWHGLIIAILGISLWISF